MSNAGTENAVTQGKLEIHELVAKLFHAIDDKNLEAYQSLFVDDASSESPFGVFQGRAALDSFFAHHIGPGGMGDGRRHFGLNVHADVDGDQGRVTFDLVVLEVRDVPTVIATARYDDNEVVYAKGGWRFKKLKQIIDPGFFKSMEQKQPK